jgi:hypothetical protein
VLVVVLILLLVVVVVVVLWRTDCRGFRAHGSYGGPWLRGSTKEPDTPQRVLFLAETFLKARHFTGRMADFADF